jgi:hypothetical protein
MRVSPLIWRKKLMDSIGGNLGYIHKELLGLYLYTHFPPLSFPLHIARLRSCERPVYNTSQAYDLMTSAYEALT